jgi:hypothetical protein
MLFRPDGLSSIVPRAGARWIVVVTRAFFVAVAVAVAVAGGGTYTAAFGQTLTETNEDACYGHLDRFDFSVPLRKGDYLAAARLGIRVAAIERACAASAPRLPSRDRQSRAFQLDLAASLYITAADRFGCARHDSEKAKALANAFEVDARSRAIGFIDEATREAQMDFTRSLAQYRRARFRECD